eukprot:scaffold11928_cov53-Phaeocystis_antarctica.AAC.1
MHRFDLGYTALGVYLPIDPRVERRREDGQARGGGRAWLGLGLGREAEAEPGERQRPSLLATHWPPQRCCCPSAPPPPRASAPHRAFASARPPRAAWARARARARVRVRVRVRAFASARPPRAAWWRRWSQRRWRHWLGSQWHGLFLGAPSCPGPPGPT